MPTPSTASSKKPSRRRGARPAPGWAHLLAAAAGAGTVVVTGLARSGHGLLAHPFDRRARRALSARWWDRVPTSAWWFGGRQTRRHAVSEAIGELTGQWQTLGAGALAALAVGRRRGVWTAAPVLAAVPLGLGAHAALKYATKRPRPLTARLTGKHTPSFPSGHASRGAAAAGILGYVAVREGVLPVSAALPLAGLLAASAAGRVYVDRHWSTDTLGGWGLGLAAAALCAVWYDRVRSRGAMARSLR